MGAAEEEASGLAEGMEAYRKAERIVNPGCID